VLQARGDEFSPLVSLIVAATQIETRKRPSSYEALLRLIGSPREAHGLAHHDSVGDVIVRAAFLRDTGRNQESLELLRSALKTRPVNPELINSYAIQLWKLGNNAEAYSAWKAAIESLKLTNGRHEHKAYPDPAVNLAWRMVAEEQFEKADEFLTLVSVWCRDAQHALYSYMEMGWWHLYHGRFENAWKHIVTCGQSKTPDEMSLWSLTLAAWLSDDFEQKVNALGKIYPSVKKVGETTALLSCVIATYCPPQLRDALVAMAYPKYEEQLAAIAKETGLASPDWRGNLPPSIIRLVIRSLDARVTGGRHIGSI
jgi:tetratricopeptide (TPR) repeat protein